MTQTFLMVPSGKPIRARTRDPLDAVTMEEFEALFEAKNRRTPSNSEMLKFYDCHPELYEQRFHEPYSFFQKRCRSIDAEAEKREMCKRKLSKGVR
jgi:hypothetical protein